MTDPMSIRWKNLAALSDTMLKSTIESMSREDIITLLSWNDSNGAYADDHPENVVEPLSNADLENMLCGQIQMSREVEPLDDVEKGLSKLGMLAKGVADCIKSPTSPDALLLVLRTLRDATTGDVPFGMSINDVCRHLDCSMHHDILNDALAVMLADG